MKEIPNLTQEERNTLKTKLQIAASKKVEEQDATLLEWCVGVGKSRAYLRAAEIVNIHGNHLIVSSEKVHIDNWKKEIEEYGSICRFEISTYHSLKKVKLPYYDTICLDEVHNLTEARAKELLNLKWRKLIMLSAEVPVEKKLLINKRLGRYFHWHISLIQAIENGLIPKPNVKIINIYPDNRDAKYTYQVRDNKKYRTIEVSYIDYKRYLNQAVNMRVKCTEAQYLELLQSELDMWQKQYYTDKAEWVRFKILQLGSSRKRFMASLKTEYLKRLIDEIFINKRFICFTGSIAQCEEMSDNSMEVAHSKTGMPASEQIEAFNEKKINRLFVVNIAREGVNLVDLDMGIIAQADGSFLMSYQKLGRLVRGKEPLIYVLRLMHSKDEKFVNNFFEALPKHFIEETTIEAMLNEN